MNIQPINQDFLENEKLILENTDLVKQIVYKMKRNLPPSVQADDMLQAGTIGLMSAAKRFDSSRGANFSTYAGIRIRGAIMDEVRTSDWTPRSVSRNIREIAAAKQRIEAKTGKRATERAIAHELEITLPEFHRISRRASESRLISTEDHVDDNGVSIIDSPSPEQGPQENFLRAIRLKHVSSAIKNLPEKERLVLSLYYDDDLNLKEIAKILEVSESRISQMHIKAIKRLKKERSVRDC